MLRGKWPRRWPAGMYQALGSWSLPPQPASQLLPRPASLPHRSQAIYSGWLTPTAAGKPIWASSGHRLGIVSPRAQVWKGWFPQQSVNTPAKESHGRNPLGTVLYFIPWLERVGLWNRTQKNWIIFADDLSFFSWLIFSCILLTSPQGAQIRKHSDWINRFKNYSDVTAGQFLTLLIAGFKSLLGKNKCSCQCHNSSTLL